MKIAQPFKAGLKPSGDRVPKGRLKPWFATNRPLLRSCRKTKFLTVRNLITSTPRRSYVDVSVNSLQRLPARREPRLETVRRTEL